MCIYGLIENSITQWTTITSKCPINQSSEYCKYLDILVNSNLVLLKLSVGFRVHS